jgi:hypothetical protein
LCGKEELMRREWLLKIEDCVGREKTEQMQIEKTTTSFMFVRHCCKNESSDCNMKNSSKKIGV